MILPKTRQETPESGRKGLELMSSMAPAGSTAHQQLDLRLLASKTREDTFLLLKPLSLLY